MLVYNTSESLQSRKNNLVSKPDTIDTQCYHDVNLIERHSFERYGDQ
jgi:hypothetical protein